MDSNNTTDTSEWIAQLKPESRQLIINKIIETLKKHLSASDPEVQRIAEGFEDKIYNATTSQADYLRKISMKMLIMETKSKNTIPNNMPSNEGASGYIDLMDSNNTTDTSEWRAQLKPESRQRIINKIIDTLKKHLPASDPEVQRIAEGFEDKIYNAATSQADYLRKISMKMLTMETKSENTIPNYMPSNKGGPSNNSRN